MAQEVIATAGHNAKVGDAQLSWTVGEACHRELWLWNLYPTQGFQTNPPHHFSTDDLPFPS
jgi:hypothetical protein